VQGRAAGVPVIDLVIAGEPLTKSNARSAAYYCQQRKRVAYRTTPKIKNYEDGVHIQALEQVRGATQQGSGIIQESSELPVFPRPRALFGAFDFYFSVKPTNRDVQNYFKSVCDALESVVYENDSQLVEVRGRKFYDKEKPRVEVRIFPVEWNMTNELNLLGDTAGEPAGA